MAETPLSPLVLASASPRRRDLLAQVGIPIEIRPAAIDESVRPGEDVLGYARRVAAAKADAVAAECPGRWVLAADTVVEIEGDILGKASDEAAARAMLRRLVGRTHRVSTAFVLRGPGQAAFDRVVTTQVRMRQADDGEIDSYVRAGEWQGKAGAYAVQGMAAALVTEIHGSITNVIGLPLSEVIEALVQAGAGAPRYAQGVAA